MIYADRKQAGQELAEHLGQYSDREDVLVLALPRGGVPVAFEVARNLHVQMDIFLVRKLGMPGQEEFAMGAIASGDVCIMNQDIIQSAGINPLAINEVIAREKAELHRREQAYRGNRVHPVIEGKTVIVVDDGLATGATMLAAVTAIQRLQPSEVIVAVPVGSPETCDELLDVADVVVCPQKPTPFYGVGRWYHRFDQTSDQEVLALLDQALRLGAVGEGQPAAPTHGGRAKVSDKPSDWDRYDVAGVVRRAALPLTGDLGDYDALMDRIGTTPLVLLGEASHGTHEFYQIRADITRRLIEEKGFTAVAVEADWPDAYQVNRYVRVAAGAPDNTDAAMAGFKRFPTWMWRNVEVFSFIEWLRAYNVQARAPWQVPVGFYGLDLYSLHSSIAAVLAYLDQHDPAAAEHARFRYGCFDRFGEDVQAYGRVASRDPLQSCEEEAVAQLRALNSVELAGGGAEMDAELFSAQQNARLVRNAEGYYRSMFRGRDASWNLRDSHMMETLQALMRQRPSEDRAMKIVVWAHNSHLGDARATDMSRRGEINLGQLVREQYRDDAVLVGFSTHHGRVTAASDWDGPAQRKVVRPGLPGSYEAIFHAVGIPRFQLRLDDDALLPAMERPRLQRAIGVIYRPETERQSHYFHTTLNRQFDWMIHIDETAAVRPLEPGERWHSGEEVPETYPSGI